MTGRLFTCLEQGGKIRFAIIGVINIINIQRAVRFVKENGTGFHQSSLRFKAGAAGAPCVLENLSACHNRDGGWIGVDADYTGDISSITCTITGLRILDRLKIGSCPMLDATIQFLKRNQKAGGYWDEPVGILEFDIPNWYIPKYKLNQIWLTSGVLRYLTTLAGTETEMIAKAKNYLRSQWDGERFPGYAHNSWMGMVSFYKSADGSGREIWDNCLQNVTREITAYDIADVVWALESCLAIGLGREHRAVAAGLGVLLSVQDDDGGFITSYGASHRADVTVEILDILHQYGYMDLKTIPMG